MLAAIAQLSAEVGFGPLAGILDASCSAAG